VLPRSCPAGASAQEEPDAADAEDAAAAHVRERVAGGEEMTEDGAAATKLEEFHFDLNGYVVIKNALSAREVAALNGALDALPRLRLGEWLGHAHMTSGPGDVSLQQLYELGAPFERLVDHPAYFAKLRRFIGGDGWDNSHAPLTIDEAFANFRATGGSIPMHGASTRDGNAESAGGRLRRGPSVILPPPFSFIW
jgi:hypothetical protein